MGFVDGSSDVGCSVFAWNYEGRFGPGLFGFRQPVHVRGNFQGNRRMATVVGVALYILGGWAFAFLYFLMLTSLNLLTWWAGGLLGLVHGLVLLVAALPLFPLIHPRMASDFDAPIARPVLEPPGFLALNYGSGTPLAMQIGRAHV